MPTWSDSARVVGRNIARLRKARGWTQEAFIHELEKVDREALSKIERGKRNVTVRTLQKIANALEVPLSDLFKGTRGP